MIHLPIPAFIALLVCTFGAVIGQIILWRANRGLIDACSTLRDLLVCHCGEAHCTILVPTTRTIDDHVHSRTICYPIDAIDRKETT